VEQENKEKVDQYMADRDKALAEVAGDRESVPFEEAAEAMDKVPLPDLQKPPRRTRKERQTEQAETTEQTVCEADTYFYLEATDNYVMKHKGDAIPDGAKVISKEEFIDGCKRISQESAPAAPAEQDNPVDGAMNPPETPVRGQRRRRTR
jgi:transcriptional regulator of met regulon